MMILSNSNSNNDDDDTNTNNHNDNDNNNNDMITSDYLTTQLELAQKKLESVETTLDEQVLFAFFSSSEPTTKTTTNNNNNDDNQNQNQLMIPKSQRLMQLQTTTNSLILAQKITELIKTTNRLSSSSNDLMEECQVCLNLNKILLEHTTQNNQNIDDDQQFQSLIQQAYVPLYEYLVISMKLTLKQILKQVQYPNTSGCLKLIQDPNFQKLCTKLHELELNHNQLLLSIEEGSSFRHHHQKKKKSSFIVLELLFRPIVKRIKFHFVERSEDRITSWRIDKLPEWIFNYIKEHVLQLSSLDDDDNDIENDVDNINNSISPIDVIKSINDDGLLVLEFLNDLTRLFHWVLMERNFFRDQNIAGPPSNPLLLYNAMEQLLLYDRCIQKQLTPSMMLMISSSSSLTSHHHQQSSSFSFSSGDDDDKHYQQQHHHHLVTMMDLILSYDEELVQWWMERERESVFGTLFEDDSAVNVPKPLANHVSPRTEIFCSLIRSVQWKAAILRNPGPYMKNVAVPLCNSFVDALQETCTDLRELLCQRTNSSYSQSSEDQLLSNINEWIEIINGTHLAAQLLLRSEGGAWQTDGMPATSQSDHDLARFGRSLRNLHTVMIEEFAKSFVETVLMERAKLASYLMLASHILSSEEWEGGSSSDDGDLSPELRETKTILYQFHQLCNSILLMDDDNDAIRNKHGGGGGGDFATTTAAQPGTTIGGSNSNNNDDEQHNIAAFAPLEMRSHVMNRIATKFLDVALDVDNQSPEIWQSGAKVFCRDVGVIMGTVSSNNLPLARRLMEVTKLLSLDTMYIRSLFDALAGLVGSDDGYYLDINDFTTDGTVYEEATSMIKAKGFVSLELEDALSVLNRRRD